MEARVKVVIVAGSEVPPQWQSKLIKSGLIIKLAPTAQTLQKEIAETPGALVFATPKLTLELEKQPPSKRWIALVKNAQEQGTALQRGAFACLSPETPIQIVLQTAATAGTPLTTRVNEKIAPYPLPTLLIDEEHRVIWATPEVAELLNLPTAGELLGRHISVFLPEIASAPFPTIAHMETTWTTPVVTVEGERVPVRLQFVAQAHRYVVTLVPISEEQGEFDATALLREPPESMLRLIVSYIYRNFTEAYHAFYLQSYGNAFRIYTSTVPIYERDRFAAVLGFALDNLHLPICHIPAVREALERREPAHIPVNVVHQLVPSLEEIEKARKIQSLYPYRTLLLYPLYRGAEAVGMLAMFLTSREVPEGLLDALEHVATPAAFALTHEQLREQVHQQRQQMAALHAVSLRVSRSLDLEVVMQQAVEEVTRVLKVGAAGISLIEAETGDLVIRAQRGLQSFASTPVRIPKGKGVAWETLAKRETTVIDSWENEPRLATPEFREEQITTTVLVPMLVGEEPVGVLSAMNHTPREFAKEELDLLDSIADQVALALANARLHEETRRQSHERAYLFNLAAAITPLHDVSAIAREALDQTLKFLNWPVGAFLVEDQESGALVTKAHQGSGESIQALIVRMRETKNHQHQVEYVVRVSHADSPPRTMLQVPLSARRNLLGWLILGTPPEVDVPHHVLEVLSAQGKQLGVTVENVRLYQEMAEREQSTRALYQITRTMTGHDLTAMLEQTLEELHQSIPYAVGCVLLADGTPMEILRLRRQIPPERLDEIEARLQSAMASLGDFSNSWSHKNRIVVESGDDDALEMGHLLSYLEAPILQDGEPIGVMLLARRRPFRARDQRTLFIVAYQLSKVLITIRLFQQAQRQAQQLQEVNERLEAQEAIQIELFDDVAHELRNPVTFIRGYTELLLEEELNGFNENQTQALNVLQQQAHLLSRLVHDLGTMKVIDTHSIQYQEVDLAELLYRAADAARIQAAEKELVVKTKIPKSLPKVWMDMDRILQVVVNLLGNAVKFTPSGGEICLKARRENSEYVRISVCDTGPGIPEAERALVFKRLYQGQLGRKYPGMGIGLAVSQRIVETHHGTIGVQSEEGQGSTFYFQLPITPPENGAV